MTVADVVDDIRRGVRRSQEVEDARLKGQPAEDPDDALQLSLGMAASIQRAGRAKRIFEDTLELAGRILCPLFDYAKPDEYRAEMQRVRLQYRGIARDADMQHEWLNRTEAVAGGGVLESVESAVKFEVWRVLERERSRGAGEPPYGFRES